MIPRLPPEILSQIIEQAALRPSPPCNDTHPYHLRTLTVLCLVSKFFYAHATRLLYSTVRIPRFSSALPLPADLTLVRTLIILDDRIPRINRHDLREYTPAELDAWRSLEDAVVGMVNLERVVYDVDHHSPRLAATLSRLPGLRHLTCGNTDNLGPLPALHSLSVHWLPWRPITHLCLPGLLHTSHHTLRSLHISTALLGDVHAPGVLLAMFKHPHKPLRLQSLILTTVFTRDAAQALVQAVDFSVLEHLVVNNPAADLFAALQSTEMGALRKLRVTGAAAAGFVAAFGGLWELEWMVGKLDVRVVVGHKALKRLKLTTDTIGGGGALCAGEVDSLVRACRGIEHLTVVVDFTDLPAIATSLSALTSLHQLTLNSAHRTLLPHDPSPYTLSFAHPPSIHPLNAGIANMFPFLPYLFDGLDAALAILLSNGVGSRDIQIWGMVLPYWGEFEVVFKQGRVESRTKRWVCEGEKVEGVDFLEGRAWRGGNVGDWYLCGDVKLVQAVARGAEGQEMVRKQRVPSCCRKRSGR